MSPKSKPLQFLEDVFHGLNAISVAQLTMRKGWRNYINL